MKEEKGVSKASFSFLTETTLRQTMGSLLLSVLLLSRSFFVRSLFECTVLVALLSFSLLLLCELPLGLFGLGRVFICLFGVARRECAGLHGVRELLLSLETFSSGRAKEGKRETEGRPRKPYDVFPKTKNSFEKIRGRGERGRSPS